MLRERNRDPVVISHGVDPEHWKSKDNSGDIPECLRSLEGPIVLFWGLIDRRLDIGFLDAVGRLMDRGSIVLVGPEQDPEADLARVPRLHRVGPVPFEELPAIAVSADVLIMPYADLPVTRAIKPLKVKEYLATGKPVVARNLPGIRNWADCLDMADHSNTFAEAVVRRIEDGLPASQATARQRLENETWSVKAAVLKQVLFG